MRETPQFPDNFRLYLEANGYREDNFGTSWTSFRKDDIRLFVKADTIEVFRQPADNQRKPMESLTAFRGWPLLSEFTFVLLMHAMNVVPLRSFVQKVKQEFGEDAASIESLFRHFKTELLPESY